MPASPPLLLHPSVPYPPSYTPRNHPILYLPRHAVLSAHTLRLRPDPDADAIQHPDVLQQHRGACSTVASGDSIEAGTGRSSEAAENHCAIGQVCGCVWDDVVRGEGRRGRRGIVERVEVGPLD